jgi:hypothetical protein
VAHPIFEDEFFDGLMDWRGVNKLAEKLFHKYEWLYGDDGTLKQTNHVTDDKWAWVGYGKTAGYLAVLPTTPGIYDWEGATRHPKLQQIRAGKALLQILTDSLSIPDSVVEDLVNRIKARQSEGNADWRLLEGDEIADAYDHGRYVDSCMVRKPHDYFDLYTKNPNVRMLTYWRFNELQGRAIVWTADDGETYVDRAYGSDAIRQAFRDEAARRGWYKKAADSYDMDERRHWLKPDGQRTTRDVAVSLVASKLGKYPYVDTLMYLDPIDKTLSTIYRAGRGQHSLRSTDGSPNLYPLCNDCGADLSDTDDYHTRNGRMYCDDCARDRICPECDEWTGDGSLCAACAVDYLCRQCNEYTGVQVTDGYCADCVDEHRCISCLEIRDEIDDAGYCDDCAPVACQDCGAEVDLDLDEEYCAECLPKHTCKECGSVSRHADGYCGGCRVARRCDACTKAFPLGDIIKTTERVSGYYGGSYDTTRRICVSCERDRLARTLSMAHRAYLARQAVAGQIDLIAREG